MDGAGVAAGASYITRRQPQTLSIRQVTLLRVIHSLLCWPGQGNGVLQLILACNYLLFKTAGLVLSACTHVPEKMHDVCHSHNRERSQWLALKADIKRIRILQQKKTTTKNRANSFHANLKHLNICVSLNKKNFKNLHSYRIPKFPRTTCVPVCLSHPTFLKC